MSLFIRYKNEIDKGLNVGTKEVILFSPFFVMILLYSEKFLV